MSIGFSSYYFKSIYSVSRLVLCNECCTVFTVR